MLMHPLLILLFLLRLTHAPKLRNILHKREIRFTFPQISLTSPGRCVEPPLSTFTLSLTSIIHILPVSKKKKIQTPTHLLQIIYYKHLPLPKLHLLNKLPPSPRPLLHNLLVPPPTQTNRNQF